MKSLIPKIFGVSTDDLNQKRIMRRTFLLSVVLVIITGVISYWLGYNNGFKYQPRIASDSSPYVCITPSGKCYHMHWCETIRNTSIDISIKQAKEKGYAPCKLCEPDRLNKKR